MPSATTELNGIPVGSTPIFLKTASSPDSCMTWHMVNTFEQDWIEKE